MPYALILSGIVLIVAGARGTQTNLFSLLQGDLTGQSSFLIWLVAITIIGALGYVPKFKGVSIMFMSLIFVSLILSNRGVFAQLTSALSQDQSATASLGNPTQSGLGSLPGLPQLPAIGQNPNG